MPKHDFEFKSTKGSKVVMTYEPTGNIQVNDEKSFEGYLKKIIDFIEIDSKPKKKVLPEEKPKPKPKVEIAGLGESKDEDEDEDEEEEEQPTKTIRL